MRTQNSNILGQFLQRILGTLPAQPQQMYFSQPFQQSQHHVQANELTLKQELNINQSKVSCKRDIPAQNESEKDAKHKKECGY
jgi:hypothetical protein